jgi:hypothetical protein
MSPMRVAGTRKASANALADSPNIDERQAFKFRELVAVISSVSQLNYGR